MRYVRNYILIRWKWFAFRAIKIKTITEKTKPRIHEATNIGAHYNLCPKRTDLRMAVQIFSPDKNEKIVMFSNHIKTWQRLAKWLGLFSSESQAKKNGWLGDIPYGYTERKIKSKQIGFMGHIIYLYFPPE